MPSYPSLNLFIGGDWMKAKDGLPVVNPADESVIGQVPVATRAQLDLALTAAAEGFRVWSRTSPAKRAAVILKAAALMRERIDEIAFSITLEHGKPYQQARLEVIRGCEFFVDAAEGQRAYGRVIPSEPGIRYVVLQQPIGMVAAFSPWNFPMSQPARKIAGALAAGCSIIIKASEETPAGALHIARAFQDAGLPAGVLNLVFGIPSEISSYLIPQAQTRLIAFTGSTAVGSTTEPSATCAGADGARRPRPGDVCDDVDPVAAAKVPLSERRAMPARSALADALLLQEAIYSASSTSGRRAPSGGRRHGPATEMGPLANHRRDALEALVADARAMGAHPHGRERLGNRGYFFLLTVVSDLPDDARHTRTSFAGAHQPGPRSRRHVRPTPCPSGSPPTPSPIGRNADMLADGIEAGTLSINTLEARSPRRRSAASTAVTREGGARPAHYMVVKNVSHRMTI